VSIKRVREDRREEAQSPFQSEKAQFYFVVVHENTLFSWVKKLEHSRFITAKLEVLFIVNKLS